MKTSDIATICAVIAAVASAVSAPALEMVFPGHGTYIAGVLALAGLAAGQITRVLTNKTDAPAKAVIADAPVVPAGTTVAPPADQGHPTVLSTTTELIPQKG